MKEIDRLHGSYFDWLSWRGGALIDLGIVQRENIILSNSSIIRKHSIGYCPGEEIVCRPKKDTVAVMFLLNEETFWTHLTKKEFNTIFKGF